MSCSLNSTALNPSIASAHSIMNVWTINNTSNRFYLPIGQQPYDNDIVRDVTIDDIKITYSLYRLEFFINLMKVPLQHHSNLFRLFIVDPPEPKLPPVNHVLQSLFIYLYMCTHSPCTDQTKKVHLRQRSVAII